MKNILTNEENSIYIDGKVEDGLKLLYELKKYDLIIIQNSNFCNDINSFVNNIERLISLLNKKGTLIINIQEDDQEVIGELSYLLWGERMNVVKINESGKMYFLFTNNEEGKESGKNVSLSDLINRYTTILEICDDKGIALISKEYLKLKHITIK